MIGFETICLFSSFRFEFGGKYFGLKSIFEEWELIAGLKYGLNEWERYIVFGQPQQPPFLFCNSGSFNFKQCFESLWSWFVDLTSLTAFNSSSNAVETFSAAMAEVSINKNPFLSASYYASSTSTYLALGFYLTRSILLPTSITRISGSARLIKFSIHVSSKSSNDFLFVTS